MPNFNLTDASGLRTVIGHIGKEPMLRYTPSGKRVAQFTLATNFKNAQGQTDTTWHSVNAWEERADQAMSLHKGQVCCVVGKESSREYNGKQYVEISAWFVGVEVKAGPAAQPAPPSDLPPEPGIPF